MPLIPSSKLNTGSMTPKAKALGGIKTGIKKVGKFFLEPTRNVNQIRNAAMTDMSKKAASGEFNQ